MNVEVRKATLLIVDDEPTNISIIVKILCHEHEVLTATSGQEALEIAARCSPDLILLDVVMPGMDGYEVCRRLRNSEITKSIPVIFVTAKGRPGEEEYGLNLGAVDYITKPFKISIVRARVRNHVNLKLKTDLLETLAALDGLTGVPNRRHLDKFLEAEWKRGMRNSSPLSMIMVDVDHFKLYNDHFGHGTGDDCLKQVAEALASSLVRPGDMVARYGGEEFAAVLSETDNEGAFNVAERIRSMVEALAIPHSLSVTANHVTVSLGCATMIPSSDTNWMVLLDAADKMLYQAKCEGRNRVCSTVVGEGIPEKTLEPARR